MSHTDDSAANMVGQSLDAEQIAQVTPFLNNGLGDFLGLRYQEISPDRVVAEWTLGPTQYQPAGLIHGGVYCAVVEGLASIAGTWWLAGKGTVVGTNNSTDFIRAAREGVLVGTATPIHRGRTQQLWLVEIQNDQDKLIARGQVRLANLTSSDHLGK